MIKETLTESQFIDALMGDEYASWSYGACVALYDYYNEFDEDIELDIVAIRCEWSEYESAIEAYNQYMDISTLDQTSDDLGESIALEWLQERTTVLVAESPKCDESNDYKLERVTSYVIHEF